MNKLFRYLFSNLFQTTLYSLLALVALYGLFDILVEGGDLVKGSKDFLITFQYVFIRLPVYIYQIAPIAILIGAIVALTRLVRNNEYVVIRTSGVSLFKVSRVLLSFAVVSGILLVLVGEYLVPSSEEITDQMIAKSKVENVSMLGKHNVWLKLDDEVIELWEVLPDYTFKNVLRYQLIDNKKIGYIKFSKVGEYQGSNTWELKDVSTVNFQDHKIVSTHSEVETWKPNLNLDLLNILINKPKNMSVQNLRQYIDYLNNNHQKTINYEVEMWKKIFYPFSLLVMVLIALVFTPTISRYTNVGLKIILSILVGLVYFFSIRFLGFFTQITNINPVWFAALPTIIFMLILIMVLYYQDRGYMTKA
ncbi:LPS export ABC transporter permease LptG [Neisseriaceae bacterium PsAf]|nr:LPS export ABC transporter permease LptG [Neisseriaceae bacterium PsAf]